MVLSWSRAIYARFALDQTLESFLRGHVEAFNALRGVPRTILYDNLKSVVLERAGDHIRFHPRVLDLAGHYHYAPKPCAPYRGNEKGKVERTIQYLRHGFFAARRFTSIQDLNAQLTLWIEQTADARKVPGDPAGRLVRDALEEERPRLLPLPEHAFECDLVKPVASGKTPYIRFDLNDYSIPHHLVGLPLTLIASDALVRITNGCGRVFASHARSYDRKQVIDDPEHIAELAREKRHAHELRGRDRLRSACPSADAFVEAWPCAARTSGATSRGSSPSSTATELPSSTVRSRTRSRGARSAPPRSPTSSTSALEPARRLPRSTSSSPTIPASATFASSLTPSTLTTPSASRRRRTNDDRSHGTARTARPPPHRRSPRRHHRPRHQESLGRLADPPEVEEHLGGGGEEDGVASLDGGVGDVLAHPPQAQVMTRRPVQIPALPHERQHGGAQFM
jgi:hypothetical protein